jgi:hypothetical protein
MNLKSSMKTTLILLLAILASFTATGQTANIPFTYLPFTISAPGTYVLNTDLTSTNVNSVGVAINQQAVGNIVLNLNGHTLHGNGAVAGITVNLRDVNGANLTIRNGTLDGFYYGIETNAEDSPAQHSHFLVENVTFKSTNNNTVSISLENTNGAVIGGCKFLGVMRVGIWDAASAYGNTYSNLSFDGQQSTNIQEGGSYPQTVSFQAN